MHIQIATASVAATSFPLRGRVKHYNPPSFDSFMCDFIADTLTDRQFYCLHHMHAKGFRIYRNGVFHPKGHMVDGINFKFRGETTMLKSHVLIYLKFCGSVLDKQRITRVSRTGQWVAGNMKTK